MDKFFNAVWVLSILFIVLILYYVLKNFWKELKNKRRGDLFFRKIYEDERTYYRNKLKILLADMAAGKIHWLLISSRIFPEEQIQITYEDINNTVNIIQRGRKLSGEEIQYLRNLGVDRYENRHEEIILSTALNSKIITDVIYFLLENIYNQRKAHNLRIKISGE